MRTRGMRDIPTAFGLAKRTKPNSRDEAITEMARLEHEKARLEREMALWAENQKRTEKHLQRVRERLAMLEQIVANRASERAPEPAVKPDAGADQPEGEATAEKWATIKLEY